MSHMELEIQNHIAIVTMHYGENRLNPRFLESFNDMLDRIEHETEATALVVTSAHEKIFCNGIDLAWLIPVVKSGDIKSVKDYIYMLNRSMRRLVLYPLLTVAAINGHAFAGGAVMSSCFDFRFMRAERGFFCLPEVNLGVPFTPGMTAVLGKAIPRFMLEDLEYSGKRLTPGQCEQYHIITKACPMETLMQEVLLFAGNLNKRREIVQALKQEMNKDIVRVLDVEDPERIESGWDKWFTDQVA
ncbi:MAG: enoyl-CoA hydratase/isomerase family protein [Deltaproteobacteria bacterium]|nr:enoyl-CoA hydratase/isomerase family protein [Deltaproteobacteria bacterium]